MEFGDILKKLRKEHNESQNDIAKFLNVDRTTVGKWENNSSEPDTIKMKMLAKHYNVSMDYLLGYNDIKKNTLTEKDKKDIAKQVEDMLDGLNTENALAFQLDGKPIDEEIRRILKNSLQNTLEFARLKAKEKYTPNKYKK